MARTFTVCIALLLSSLPGRLYAQKRFPGYLNSEVTCYVSFNGGIGASFGTAYWLLKENLIWKIDAQPGVNLAFNFTATRYSLGNKNRQGSRTQLNVVLSPMSAFGFAGKAGYEEINTFKTGQANAMMSNNRWQVVLGSNYILTPKSNVNIFRAKFNKQNVYATKNRSQQLIFVSLRGGVEFENQRRISFQFMHYNDNMIIPYLLQRYADNYDRYYTGGIRASVSYFHRKDDMYRNPATISYFKDVYTGAFERDLFDFPDVYDIDRPIDTNKPEIARKARIVNQEPGERMLNDGRNIFNVNIPIGNSSALFGGYRNMGLNFFAGFQGGEKGMRSQDKNHNRKIIYKVNPRYSPFILHHTKGKDKIELERFHHFDPPTKAGRVIFGFGTNYNL